MSFITAFSKPSTSALIPLRALQTQTRSVSSSPYGRTHVWKRRPNKLPNPVVPQFPQRVIRSDGSTFTHWTTSPRSVIRLTRDVTNNPQRVTVAKFGLPLCALPCQVDSLTSGYRRYLVGACRSIRPILSYRENSTISKMHPMCMQGKQ